jgi:hypothetical protein
MDNGMSWVREEKHGKGQVDGRHAAHTYLSFFFLIHQISRAELHKATKFLPRRILL